MIAEIVTVYEDDTIKKALDIMMDKKVNGTPVVNKEGFLQGMIVKADIYRFMTQPGHYDSCPVEWVMTRNVVTAKSSEDISSVGKRLREFDIIAMPIIDEDNRVIGIISIEDLLDFFLKETS